jgi:hypothetical protein
MSTLIAGHNPKFNSKLTTLDALRQLPEPQPLGVRHHPVPHAVLVHALLSEVERRGYTTQRTQLALGANGAALFGILDLTPTQAGLLVPDQERILSLGFRNATDQSLAIQGVAGAHVMVCDNLALSGQTFAFKRKNTTGLDLGDAIATGFDRFLQHARTLELQIERLAGTTLLDGPAKQIIFDVFHAHIIPVRLFNDVSRFYFHPTDDQPDCQPRTQWGLHNAFTRAMRDLTPLRQFGATQGLGRAFGLTASEEPVLESRAVAIA